MAAGALAVQQARVSGRDMEAMRRNRRASDSGEGRLLARPGTPTEHIDPGMHPLGLGGDRDAALYIPDGYQPEKATPFVLSLHGAGGNELSGLYPLQVLADEFGFILLSPASRGRTWDVILGGFGPDIAFLDRALAATFERCSIDRNRIAVSGFSDGASYALSIGITNGDLFPNILAFSPGFAAPGPQQGEPRIFVSHGTKDEVLRIDYTSRRVVPVLQDAGYEVRYQEFNGPHTVPDDVAREAVEWFLAREEPASATPTP
jgi:phospholipase/carboxylesterase